MEESSNKMLYMVAGIILAVLVITTGFFVYNKAKTNTDKALSAMDNLMADVEITQYAGNNVSGITVLNAIRYFQSTGTTINIKVTVTNTVNYLYSYDSAYKFTKVADMDKLIRNAETPSDPDYINPTLSFTGTIVRNPDSNAIIGITYTKN